MKRWCYCVRASIALTALLPASAPAWGLATHRAVVETSIETVAEPLRDYLRAHREELSDWTVEPDTVLKERHGRAEVVKHFIDLDLYGAPPFAELPRSYRAAIRRFGRKSVEERGIVPWTIEQKHARMVRELRAGRWRAALRTAAYAGHYVADATMPLHAVSDYDGQQSGHPGVHKAVERDLVDRRLDAYRRAMRAAAKPASAAGYGIDRVFVVLAESFAAAPQLLALDREARAAAPLGSPEYVERLDRSCRKLIASRLDRAVELLGALWQSAWEEAGKPTPPRAQ
jgi:hypothetical protein